MTVRELIEKLKEYGEDAYVTLGVELWENNEKAPHYRENRSIELRNDDCLDARGVQIVVRLKVLHDFFWDLEEAK